MTVQDEAAATGSTAPSHGAILTDAAAAKAKSLLDQEGRDDLALRIAVQPGGCAGLRYNLFFDDRSLDGDLTADFGGVTLTVDRMSAHREAGLHHRQPERHGLLRLRRFVQLIGSCRSQHVGAHQHLVVLEQ